MSSVFSSHGGTSFGERLKQDLGPAGLLGMNGELLGSKGWQQCGVQLRALPGLPGLRLPGGAPRGVGVPWGRSCLGGRWQAVNGCGAACSAQPGPGAAGPRAALTCAESTRPLLAPFLCKESESAAGPRHRQRLPLHCNPSAELPGCSHQRGLASSSPWAPRRPSSPPPHNHSLHALPMSQSSVSRFTQQPHSGALQPLPFTNSQL